MLYVLSGTDIEKSRAKLHLVIERLQEKKPDAELFRVDGEAFIIAEFESLLFGQGLFEKKYIVVLDHVFESSEAKEVIVDNIKQLGDSESMFVLLEEKIDAPTKKKLEKHAHKIEEFVNKKQQPEFNVFALTDAVGSRDKKKAWLLYREAIESGKKDEEIHGILVWQLKSMILAQTSKSAKEAGMKPFPYKKAKEFAQKYSSEELKKLETQLVEAVYESRRQKDLGAQLERFMLSL